MKSFGNTQKQMLKEMRKSSNWIVANIVDDNELETVKYALEFKIPKEVDPQHFKDAAVTLIMDLDLASEANVYSLKKDGKDNSILVTIGYPEIVEEIVNCKNRDITSVNSALQFVIYESNQRPNLREKDMQDFRNELLFETNVRYQVFQTTAVNTGIAYNSQRAADRVAERELQKALAVEENSMGDFHR